MATNGIFLALAAAGAALLTACSPPTATAPTGPPHVVAASPVEAGRYLTLIGGCNDCHSPGYPESGGKTPEDTWLTGVPVGYAGPWGTSYPANLRLTVQRLDEAAWIARLRGEGLPPMPWANMHQAADSDLTAIYAYIKSLPVKGNEVPVALAPGVKPEGPYYWFVPVTGPLPPMPLPNGTPD